MRRPLLLILATSILLALPVPSSGAASSGGGAVAAPNGGEGGGAAFGTPAPSAKRSRRAARRATERRRAARRRRPPAPAPRPLPSGEYVFPVAGSYDLGGEGALFGAPRRGHRHMGHDVTAALGTPVVAPYSGTVDWVRFERSGAGHYVVLDADDGHDYVFMHLRRGSIAVSEGQVVAAGAELGEVGNSGRSFGAHLHFEVWTGGWYEKGGESVDPLPLLQDWATR